MIVSKNPWAIKSIHDLQYYLCPGCDFKEKSKQTFVTHALEKHPEAKKNLFDVEDGSLNDVDCSWSLLKKCVKKEESKPYSENCSMGIHG